MSRVTQADWNALVRAGEEVVETDTHGFPTVSRDLQGLYQSAQAARVRTSKLRSQQEQAAATRLLALEGFDANKLRPDLSLVELQQRVTDVFSADTTSVEDYLRQIQDMTIITAIQEAQQDALLSFERVMQSALARDWAADKGRLFGLMAPATAGADQGAGPLGGLSFGSLTTLPPAGTVFMGAGKDSAMEQAYVQAVKQLVQAQAENKPVDVIAAFAAACSAHEDKAHDALMSNCWGVLKDITSGKAPAGGDQKEGLLEGARSHLQQLFASHMRATINRNRSTALRGGDPDQLKDVQSYIAVKFRDAGQLDFQGVPGSQGQDTTWAQLFFALRAGWTDTARRAAAACSDVSLVRGGPGSLGRWLEEFLADRSAFRAASGGHLQQQCERLAAAQRQAASPLKADYQLLVYALLGGDNRALEVLFKAHPHLLPTLEDYVWAKLMVVEAGASGAGTGPLPGPSTPGGSGLSSSSSYVRRVYTLPDLQGDLNRWGAAYYSKDGKEPLLYLTVLLQSLQFRAGLRYLWREDAAAAYRVDAVHLAIALHLKGLLGAGTDAGAEVLPDADIGNMLVEFGGRYISRDSETALYYYMLAAEVAHGGIEAKGKLFRQLLVASKDYGTLLGAGGLLGSGGALQLFVPTREERQQLFAGVAYQCQLEQQLEEARELFMAAGQPLAALQLVNKQISQELLAHKGATSPTLTALLGRAAAAEQELRAAPGPVEGAQRAVEAHQQLVVLQAVLAARREGQWLDVLREAEKLQFVPSEAARVHVCAQAVRQLAEPVVDLLGELILAMTTAARGLKAAGADAQLQGVLPARVKCLKDWVLDMNIAQLRPEVYQSLNECVREFNL